MQGLEPSELCRYNKIMAKHKVPVVVTKIGQKNVIAPLGSGAGGMSSNDVQTLINLSLASKANINSPALAGTPTTPTPANGADSTQITNVGWVLGQITSALTSGTVDLSVKQDKLTATGVTNLLTAPAAAGGQPGVVSIASFQSALNRTVAGNDDVTGTATDTGSNLSIPLQVTTVAPSSSSTQTTAGTRSMRSQFKILIDNVADIFARVGTAETNIGNKANSVDVVTLANAQTLTGKKTFPAVTTSSAPLNIGVGSTITVPTTPTSGDLWINATNGFQIRNGSNTRTMADLESAQSFTAKKTFPTVTTSAAPINLGVGATTTAPSSPTTGDMWINATNGLQVRVGTTTKSYVDTDSVQTIAGTKTFSTSPVVPTKSTAAANTGTAIATEAQVYLKANIASPTFTGTVSVPTKSSAATNSGTLVATEAQVYLKENSIAAGTTSQYWRGDKTWQTFPTVSEVPAMNLGTSGWYLTNNGSVASWASLDLPDGGLLSVATEGLITGNGTSLSPVKITTGDANRFLRMNSAGTAPEWASVTIPVIGTAIGNVPSIGTALGTTANTLVGTDNTGKLIPLAGYTTSSFRSNTWNPSATDITTGTLVDVRLSSNVMLLNGSQTTAGTHQFGATSSEAAGIASRFRLPHRTTPTTLTNGDLWTTTTSLLGRINGTTRTFYHDGNLAAISQANIESSSNTTVGLITGQRFKQAFDIYNPVPAIGLGTSGQYLTNNGSGLSWVSLDLPDGGLLSVATEGLITGNGTSLSPVKITTGAANKFLKMNSGGTAPEWGDVPVQTTITGNAGTANAPSTTTFRSIISLNPAGVLTLRGISLR